MANGPAEILVLGTTDVSVVSEDAPIPPLRPDKPVRLEVEDLFKADDCTYYFPDNEVERALKNGYKSPQIGEAKLREKWFSVECNICLSKISDPKQKLNGRANIAKCFGGKLCSITVRGEPKKGSKPSIRCSRSQKGWDQREKKPKKDKFLVGSGDLCCCLGKQILQGQLRPLTGLIVISGSTNSCKSQVARGLIVELLHKIKASLNRRPHVVTLEDPVEQYLFGSLNASGDFIGYVKKHEKDGVDYTPRELGADKDCPNIATGLVDALRQTPSIVYVGEVRNESDWKHILDFAGSGHLIVTTTHAGSPVETLRNIMEAVGVDTPTTLGMMAERILAIVHLRALLPTGKPMPNALIPAMWRRTPSSVAKLVADGLSSVLPGNPQPPDKQIGSLGRFWFANKLLEKKQRGFPDWRGQVDAVKQQACGLDLCGQ